MRFTSEQRLDDGVLERDFTLGEIPGVLWTLGSAPAPLILSGHNGGLHKRLPRLVARARHYAAEYGFAVAAIDAPGCGDRPRSAADEQTAPTSAGRSRPASRSTRSSTPSSSRWSKGRSRNGGPPWTPSFRCPRSAARSGTRG